MGKIPELFVVALSLVWFAGATPESRLKTSIPLESVNLDLQKIIPTTNSALVSGSPENFNLTWHFQARREIFRCVCRLVLQELVLCVPFLHGWQESCGQQMQEFDWRAYDCEHARLGENRFGPPAQNRTNNRRKMDFGLTAKKIGEKSQAYLRSKSPCPIWLDDRGAGQGTWLE